MGRRLLGRYVVGDKVAEGGMGAVYRARDEALDGKTVVVKVPHARFLAEAGFRERFEREMRDLLVLEHPHVVRILAKGDDGGVPFFVLQYLAGGSLRERLRVTGGKQSTGEVVEWLADVAKALDFIHTRGVIHRDIKPSNILFDESDHVFVSDFGIAKALGSRDTGLTQTGATPGSPDYMAPEVVLDGRVGPAYDQYALAVVVYEALAGALPHGAGGDTPMRVLYKKAAEEPRPLRQTAPQVSPAVEAVVLRALARDPAHRFGSCAEFAQALRRAYEHGRPPAVGGADDVDPPPAAPPPAVTRSATLPGAPPDVSVRDATGGGTAVRIGVTPRDREPQTPPRGVDVPPRRRGNGRAVLAILLVAALAGGAYVAITRGLLDAVIDRLSGRGASAPPAGETASRPAPDAPVVPPPVAPAWLEWTSPEATEVVRGRKVAVVGTLLDARRGRLTVNGAEATIDGAGRFARTLDVAASGPFEVRVRFEPAKGEPLEVVRSPVIELPVPAVVIRAPTAGQRLPTLAVDVEATIDPADTVTATAEGVPLALDGTRATGRLTLDGYGRHTVTVVAKAVGVPDVVRTVDVLVDPPPAPILAVATPLDGANVPDAPIRVAGSVGSPWKRVVRVNGRDVPIEGGRFSTMLEPPELGRFAILVECDADGRPVVQDRRVVEVVPEEVTLRITAPAAGTLLATKTASVRGTVRGPIVGPVHVNGVAVDVRDGGFRVDVPVGADGPMTLTVVASRRRGPDVSAEVAVEVDRTAPKIRVTEPAGLEGLASGGQGSIRGRVEDAHATTIQAGEQSFDLDADGGFALRVPIEAGKRRVVALRAVDKAGNAASEVRVTLRGPGPRVLAVPEEFATIGAAVRAAKSGETVEVAAGTYRENVKLTSPIRLVGAGRDDVRLESALADVPALAIADTDGVEVRGLTIAGRGSSPTAIDGLGGIAFSDKAWVPTVSAVTPGSAFAAAGVAIGAVLQRVNQTPVDRAGHIELAALEASVAATDFDLRLRFSSGAAPVLRGHRSYAVRVDGARATFRDIALVTDDCSGLLAAGAKTVLDVDGVRVDTGSAGLYVGGGATGTVRNGTFTGVEGSAVVGFGSGTRLVVEACEVRSTASVAFHVFGAVGARIEGCRVSRGEYGLYVTGPGSAAAVSANVDAIDNNFSDNASSGMMYDALAVGTIRGNTCNDNKAHGIDTCGAGTKPLITGNTCRRNGSYGVVH